MKSIYATTLFIAALPGLFWSMRGMTWFEAQAKCKKKNNQSLTLSTNISSRFYWTGFYNRTSHWIKILGCYNASTLQLKDQIEFPISSPPLCQEYCLQKKIIEFAVQGNLCICLPSDFDDSKNLLHSSNCTYMCDKTLLMSSECGGESAVNVFSTDTSILDIKSRCLSLQCDDPKLVDTDCETDLPFICSNRKIVPPFYNESSPTTNSNLKWRYGMERCKSVGVYLMGKINLTDIVSACDNYKNTLRWIGVVKESYISSDQESEQMANSCQKCKRMKNAVEDKCIYVQCTDKLNSDVHCSEKTNAINPLPDITAKTTVIPKRTATSNIFSPESTDSTVMLYKTSSGITLLPTSSGRTVFDDRDLIEIESSSSSKDGSTTGTVIPVVVVIVVLGCCAVAVVFYLRRLKNKQEKEKKVKSVSTMENENYTDIESHDVHRNFILQQSNPTYQLADDAILGPGSPYSEVEDGAYDHLGDKHARKRPDEGIYNHASSAELTDLSDYDIANHKRLNEEDNNYDHTGVDNNSYGHLYSSQIRESDYSDLS